MVSGEMALYVVLAVLAVLLVVVAVWAATGRRVPLRVEGSAPLVLRAERRRSLAAIGFALAILVAGISTALCVPEWLGAGAAIAPALAGVGGLLLYAATPPPQDDGAQARYAASLSPRTPWTIAPPTALIALGVVLLLQFVLLVVTGTTSSADDLGRFRVITYSTDGVSSSAGPYPGWFYAVPLLAATVLLALAVWVALHRVATTASLPGEGLEELDSMWRSRSAQIIVGLATAAVCFQLGGVALFTGLSVGGVSFDPGAPVGGHVLSRCLVILGVVSLLLSIVVLVLAALRAVALPEQVSRVDDRAGGAS